MSELMRQHIPVDAAWPGSDLTGYRLLILPHQKILDDALVAKLTDFVTAGGTLLLGAQAGLMDRNVHIIEQTPPGPLASLAGLEIQDWTTLPENQTRIADLEDGETIELSRFVERLQLNSATPIGQWRTDDTLLAGAPAIAINQFGKGQVIYVGGYCPPAAVKTLCNWIIARSELPRTLDGPAEVEAVVREGGGRRFVFLLNHSSVAQTVDGIGGGTELLSNTKTAPNQITLGPLEVRIIETSRE